MIQGIDSLTEVLRIVFLIAAGVLAGVCLLDWMVRTRRISPFSYAGRFARRAIDPLLAPVERQVVRRGGLPASAPLWALGVAVVSGIVVLTLLDFARSQVAVVQNMTQFGGRGIMTLLISWAFQLLQIAILVRVISSWIRVSPYSPWVRWSYTLTEPMLAPLRRIIPAFGMIDLTPIIAYFALGIIKAIVIGVIAP